MKTSRRAFFLAFLLIPILLADGKDKNKKPPPAKKDSLLSSARTPQNAKQRDLRVSL